MYENYGWKYVLTAFITLLWGLGFYFNDIPLGLDLKGGSEIIYTLDFQGRAPSVEATEDAVRVLRERVDILGIKELSIRRQGNYDVVVQVPDASPTEVERIKNQIEKAGRLQFKLLAAGLSEVETGAEIARIEEQKADGTWRENDRYDVAYWHEQARGARTDQPALLENATPGSGRPLYVDGDLLANAYRTLDERGKPAVGFEWDSEGARKFRELTAAHIHRNLAIVLDGQLRSAPTIQSEIGRKGIIQGGEQGWDEKELTNLIVTLKAGALPAKPVFAYRKDVGAQLGQAAVSLGAIATVASLAAIMAFMLFYYGVRAGMVANIAMALNIYLLLGTLAMFGATLTLPGIAGIVLTAAMAVDANILIYERIREEAARGAALKQAIQAGYERAFWTIFDANLTTVLTALVLMWAGTGPIKGFGLTLTIGIVVSMFTALFVTQALYGFFVAKGFIHQINFRLLFERLNFDYWSTFPRAAVLSLSLICVGWVVFLARGEAKYGIDFTGGTALTMVLEQPMEKRDVERMINEHFSKLGRQVQVEVQRVGPRDRGGLERSREWLLRTRLIGGAAPATAKVRLPNPFDALLPAAYGQDTPPPAGEDRSAG
ncbi:MAG: protein translocase subunit SecD [Planctomycetota bacterium]|nr:protein translocase subunit SecD [Planctomycetota bacterium]